MKNLCFFIAAGCLVFSQAHAETQLQHTQTKNQDLGERLNAFWKEAKVNHDFVNAFSDSAKTLVISSPKTAQIVDLLSSDTPNDNQTLSLFQSKS
jgi:hypothetical protein